MNDASILPLCELEGNLERLLVAGSGSRLIVLHRRKAALRNLAW